MVVTSALTTKEQKMKTYKVCRKFKENDLLDIVATGLTLEEAKEHCTDPETSSSTCTKRELLMMTERLGAWFDYFTEE
jgi:hypothetical protein